MVALLAHPVTVRVTVVLVSVYKLDGVMHQMMKHQNLFLRST